VGQRIPEAKRQWRMEYQAFAPTDGQRERQSGQLFQLPQAAGQQRFRLLLRQDEGGGAIVDRLNQSEGIGGSTKVTMSEGRAQTASSKVALCGAILAA